MGRHHRSHIIVPLASPPVWSARAQYVSTLVNVLENQFNETGIVDHALADRIESVLWPVTSQ